MSKYVKNLVVQEISRRLDGVQDAVLANVVGMDANQTVVLRRQLREKDIHLLVVKNGLAKRATEGTPLGAAFEGAEGSLAVVWGAEDFVSLVKEITKLDQGQEFAKFQARGGVMDGERLTPEKVKEISKWPNRQQQLSILVGQILSPGAKLLSQINAPGGALLSQIDKKAEGADGEGPSPVDAPVGDVPVGDAPVGDAPVGDAPVGDAPVGDAPVGDAPPAPEQAAAGGESA